MLQVYGGYGLEKQAGNPNVCYFLALLGHFSFMGNLGYCFVILLDVTFIMCTSYNINNSCSLDISQAIHCGMPGITRFCALDTMSGCGSLQL